MGFFGAKPYNNFSSIKLGGKFHSSRSDIRQEKVP